MAKKRYVKKDEIHIKGNQIFSPVRRKWLPLTPEERVRQQYLFVLTEEYGYTIDQISEEMDVAGRGSAQARADFVVWRSAQDKTDQKPPFIIVETMSLT
ncbi:type I restriction enzyme HsdR N-terminal domain-containing protein [Thermodesulfobacteriota bacterium]